VRVTENKRTVECCVQLTLAMCDVFDMRGGLMRKLTSYLAQIG
jgi:hypothetical protein